MYVFIIVFVLKDFWVLSLSVANKRYAPGIFFICVYYYVVEN